MKPVSIRFRCFGPYMAEQYIDFEELEKNGLFLICGETGAGKTTILDAMCYALYGRSSGGLRGDMDVMRCKLAEKEDETRVEFIFDCGGSRYLFTRSLKYKTKNIHDSHNCMVLQGDVYVPLLENPKKLAVNKKAEELIGLTYDQFRQVIILPQGQFERLLVSDSAEKEKILVSLFQADRWQTIAKELHRRVRARDEELKRELLQMKTKLGEYGCGDLEALAQKHVQMELSLAELTGEAKTAEETLSRIKKRHTDALLDAAAFQELAKRQTRCKSLAEQEEHFRQEAEILALADGAEQVYPVFAAWQEAKNALARCEAELRSRKLQLQRSEKDLNTAREAQLVHEQGQTEQLLRKETVLRLDSAREVYTTLEQKQLVVNQSRQTLKAAQTRLGQAQSRFDAADKSWQDSLARQNRAMEEYRQTQNRYLRGIGGVLAERLTVGEPCPVCGSLEHPDPAPKGQGHITEEQLEEKNQAMIRAGELASRALQTRTAADGALTEAVSEENRATQSAALAARDLENAMERKISGIDTHEQLLQKIQLLQTGIDNYDRMGERLRGELTNAEGNRKAALLAQESAAAALADTQEEYAQRRSVWEDALKASGLETETQFRSAYLEPGKKQRRSAALVAYRTELEGAKQALSEQLALLEGKTAPDMGALEKELRSAEQNYRQLSSRLVLEDNRLKTLIADETRLTRQKAKHDEARLEVDQDMAFAERLMGFSGVSLQRYVLAVMMNSITVEANRLLENVYGGRYRLYRTDAISGSVHKGGLELEVYDSHNNQRRSVTTLSGGEKFLVALSLAIGLSAVVQAQGSGIRLEAMFIDEGFGSLDRESVQDALEVLQGIQRSAGVVGIISHVEALAESIPARIEISKGEQGSTCRVML